MSTFEIVKSKTFVTTAHRAVFPYLHEESKFGGYETNVDLIAEPEIHEALKAQAKEVWAQAGAEFGFDPAKTRPDNELFKAGETKDGEPFLRARFKMKASRKVKGREVSIKPTVVDAQNQPVTEAIYGGSLMEVAYFVQYTTVQGKRYLTLKLVAARVLELVSSSGERSVESIFGAATDGFTSSGAAPTGSDNPVAAPAEEDSFEF